MNAENEDRPGTKGRLSPMPKLFGPVLAEENVRVWARTGHRRSSGPSVSGRLMTVWIRLRMSPRRYFRGRAVMLSSGRRAGSTRSNPFLQLFEFEFFDFVFHSLSPPFSFGIVRNTPVAIRFSRLKFGHECRRSIAEDTRVALATARGLLRDREAPRWAALPVSLGAALTFGVCSLRWMGTAPSTPGAIRSSNPSDSNRIWSCIMSHLEMVDDLLLPVERVHRALVIDHH